MIYYVYIHLFIYMIHDKKCLYFLKQYATTTTILTLLLDVQNITIMQNKIKVFTIEK